MRHGIPLITTYSSQELAICTGVCDAMVVDVQCIMPSIQNVAECYHTKIITTSDIVKIPGSHHFDYKLDKAKEKAKECLQIAIDGFKERKKTERRVCIPNYKHTVVAGFSVEAILELFAAVNPENPIGYLNQAIEDGELKGVILTCGCNNAKSYHNDAHIKINKEMMKNDVLVVSTGCSAVAAAGEGLMNPDNVDELCGPGLKKFLRRIEEKANLTTKLPPMFHVGSCVDNSRAMDIMMEMAKDLGVDTPKVPFVASAPEAMSGKATAIGSWLVANGFPTHVGCMPPVEGSDLIYSILTQVASDVYGGYFMFEMDPEIASQKLLNALEYRNWKLKLHKGQAEFNETPLCQNY
jgi:carbon-monoxide dehydrogenase catalytic subunit